MNPIYVNVVLREAQKAAVEASKDQPGGFPCGGAWLTISGTDPFLRAMKKTGKWNHEDGANAKYELLDGGVYIIKGVYKGYLISFRTGWMGQGMYVRIAECEAAQKVLAAHGITTYVHSYID